MEKEETGQRQSGIFNYFEGATINNLVINNGTYNKSGVDHHYYSSGKKSLVCPKPLSLFDLQKDKSDPRRF